MNVINLSHRWIPILAPDRLLQECLDIFRVSANIRSLFIGHESGGSQVVVVNDPFHIKIFFHAEAHSTRSCEQVHWKRGRWRGVREFQYSMDFRENFNNISSQLETHELLVCCLDDAELSLLSENMRTNACRHIHRISCNTYQSSCMAVSSPPS